MSKTPSAQPDFVILTSGRWDNEYSSTIMSLAQEIAKSHRVFLVENPFTWKEYIFRRDTKSVQRRKDAFFKGRNNYYSFTNSEIIHVVARLMLPVNWLPKGLLYDTFSRINELIFSRCIRQLLKDYRIIDFVYVNSFLPFYFKKQPDYFRPRLFVYQTVDDITHVQYFSKHGPYLENEMIRSADVAITTSSHLYQLKKEVASAIYVVPNAADISLFKTAYQNQLVPPPELRNEKRKVIIYVGNTVAERTDFNVLRAILTDHPDKLLLMVGPHDKQAVGKHGLSSFPNIHFVGSKPIESVPAYLQYAHCAIIPFQCNALTKSIYPLKINEYLAAGKPVVTTPFSNDILSFDNIYVGNNPNEFSHLIDKAINEDGAEKRELRVAEAAHNSWENRAENFLGIVLKSIP
ncbi:MAG: glycosyltransferase [Tunicatimonas sp.]